MSRNGLSGNQTRVNSLVADLVVLLSLVLLGVVCTYHIEKFLDIGLYDESDMLRMGISVSSGFPGAAFSPLYCLWYYFLSLVENDTVGLYYLNFKLLTILPPLALFVALRVNRVSRILSFVLSLGFLTSCANFSIWPKVCHFAVLLLLLGFTLSSLSKDLRIRIAVLSVTALVTSYVRPEFFLTFILLGLVLAFISLRTIRETRSLRSAAPLALVFMALALMAFKFGLPVGSGNRSMIAFGQHYAMNQTMRLNDSRNPWTDWQEIVASDFGEADSPAKAMLANPAAMTQHVFTNLRRLPQEANAMFASTYPPHGGAKNALFLGVMIVLAGGVVILWNQRRTLSVSGYIRQRRPLGLFLIVPPVFLLPSAISIMLIAPRQHYLLVMGVILIVSGVIFLFRDTEHHSGEDNYALLALVCLTPLLIIRPWHTMMSQCPQPNLKTIEFIRSLKIDRPINLLEAEGGYHVHTGSNYEWVAASQKNAPFREFMTNRSVDMVILSDTLCKDSRFIDDPDWKSFIKSPSDWDFTQVSIPGVTARSLLIKKGIVSP